MAEYRNVAIGLLEENKGQIKGLPANPRQWTRMDLDSLKKSIEETPELLEARGCIAVPHEGRFVVLGGNMRLSACRELGMKEIPCYVFPESTPTAKLKEIVIKDNGSFGAWTSTCSRTNGATSLSRTSVCRSRRTGRRRQRKRRRGRRMTTSTKRRRTFPKDARNATCGSSASTF